MEVAVGLLFALPLFVWRGEERTSRRWERCPLSVAVYVYISSGMTEREERGCSKKSLSKNRGSAASLTNGDDTQDSCLLPLPPRRHLRPPIPCTIGTSSTFYPNFFLIIVPPKPPPPPPLKAIKSAPSRAIEADTKALFFLPPDVDARAILSHIATRA